MLTANRLDTQGGRLSDVLAAIDIGTNSVHMVVARAAASGRFEVVTRQKEMVRLGSGQGEMKVLEPDAIERGVQALRRCRSIADSFGAEIKAVATSAVREARNAKEFTDRAEAEAGVIVEVISGTEEARLIRLGVLQALPVFDRRMVLVDVGGGSTEVVVGSGIETYLSRSVKLGSLRMTRRFFPDGIVEEGSLDRCRRYVVDRLAKVAHEAAEFRHEVAVASSGTAEAVLDMALAARNESLPQSLNGAVVTADEITAVVELLASEPTTETRRRLRGMDPTRADILLGGAVVLEQVCLALGIEELTFSEYALREGVLLDMLARGGSESSAQLANLRESSVYHLMELCDDDPDHSVQVARLACELFDVLAPRLGLVAADRELLRAGALLANSGLFLSHSGHHKHSYYVIRNSEHLAGFTDREIEVIAQIARFHRKSPPSVDKHSEFAALSEDDRQKVRGAAALLRIAIGLDRNHDGAVSRLKLSGEDPVKITAYPSDGEDVRSDLSLECWSANERSSLLAMLLEAQVVVRQG